MKQDNLKNILNLLDTSYSVFHVVKNIEEELIKNNFIQLNESKKFKIESEKNYYIKRNDSSIIAFKIPSLKKNQELHFNITATHNDSPTFKIKPNPVKVINNLVVLDTEPYGGGIYHTFFDRPLSIAGRIFYKEKDKLKEKLINIDKNLLVIPSVAIHMQRDVNQVNNINPAIDTLPILTTVENNKEFDFNSYILKEAKLKDSKIISHDLFLYNRDKPTLSGIDDEFLLSAKEDDLSSTYSALLGFISSGNTNNISIYASFDNEEVGSLTRQGAMSTFFKDITKRLIFALGYDEEDYLRFVANSFTLSIDNAHATHPSHQEYSNRPVLLNNGIVIKYNANAHYTSDGNSSSYLKFFMENNGLKHQEFTNRSDLRGGSTLGNLLQDQVSINMVDIGLPQLAMHSSYETMGSKDIIDLIKLTNLFFSKN